MPRQYSPIEFQEVTDKNLFTEFRSNIDPTPPVPPTPEVVIPPLTPAQKPILVATVISDARQVAYIIDPAGGAPRSAPGGAPGMPGGPVVTSRRAMIKKIGDTYLGYTITRITAENIVLEASGNRKETIPLHEGSKQPKPGKTAFIPTRIAAFGGGSSSPGGRGTAVPGVPGSTTAPVGGSVVGISAASQPAAGQPTGVPGVPSVPGRGTQPSTGTPPSGGGTPPTARNVVTTPDGSRVIRTPFGDIPQ
jgi:hypothetical protein